MDGIDQLLYNGEYLPEFASTSASDRNWRFHGGTITTQASAFYDVTAISGDTLTLSSNPFSGSSAVAETLTATGGTRVFEYLGQNTTAIPFNASAATIQIAIDQLSTVTAGDITVTGTFPNFLYTFSDTAAQWSTYLRVTTDGLTGGTSTLARPAEVALTAGLDPTPSPYPAGVKQHKKLYVVYSSGNNIKLALTPGGTPITWTSSAYLLSNLKVYEATTGFFDPLQGRPEFFPNLDFTFSGICYLEVNLPAEMSEIEDEPSKFKIFVRGKRVQNYDATGQLADERGVAYNPLALPAQTKFFSANNALVALDIMLNAMQIEKTRIHWGSWVKFREHCYEAIDWNSGTIEVLGTPNFTFVNAESPELGSVKKTSATSAWDSGALTEQSSTSLSSIAMSGVYRGGHVAIGLARGSTPPLRYNDTGNLFSIHPAAIDGKLRVYEGTGPSDGTGPVYIQYNPPQIGDVYKIELNGSNVNCYKNGTLFYSQPHALGAGTTKGYVAMFSQDSSFTDMRFFPVTGTSRNTNRFDAHLVFPQETDSGTALQQVFGRCPDCHWQDVNGKIKFVVGSSYKDITWGETAAAGDRVLAEVLSYDPNNSSYLVPVDPNNPALTDNYSRVGLAVASSQQSAAYPIASINNGVRVTGGQWGITEGWAGQKTAITESNADWVEIDFAQSYPIHTINVITLRDDISYSSITTADTFTLYGIQDFLVQYWNGNTWVTIQQFIANNKVIATAQFPTIFTSKIRVYITKTADGRARIVELEAIGPQTISSTVPRSNIVGDSFSAFRTPPENKPNFLRIELRDLDDQFYTKKYVYNDRDALREQANQLIDFGIVPLGVCTQSLADRVGETTMRWSSDLDLFINLKGMAQTYALSKGDIVRVAHEVPGWELENPGQFIVIEETIEPSGDTADEKSYLLQSYNEEFYSDTAHGAISGAFPITTSALTPPPALASLSLLEESRALPDGTTYSSIVGRARFNTSYPYTQRARVYWRKSTDVEFSQTNIVLEQPNTSVIEIPFELNFAPVGTNEVKIITETVTGVLSNDSITEVIEVSGTLQIEDMEWQELVNCEIIGSFLKKTIGTDNWDASAVSTKSFAFQEMGYLQWTTNSDTSGFIAGLVGYDHSIGTPNPRYGILINVRDSVIPKILYHGTQLTPALGAEVCAPNQSYRIELTGTHVNYYQVIDGVSHLMHSHTDDGIYPLAVQSQLYFANSLLPTIQGYGNMEQTTGLKVHWQTLRRVEVTNPSGKEIVTKTGATGWGEPNSAGTFSSERISKNGAIEWEATETSTYRLAGFSEVDAEIATPNIDGYQGIQFAAYTEASSGFSIREFGVSVFSFTYTTGDIIRVERNNGFIRFRLNGSFLYESANQTTAPLFVDTAFYSNGATLKDLRLKRVGAYTSIPYVYPIYLVESLSVTASRPQDDGTVYFELSGVFDTVEELPILRAKVRVFDKFGNLVSDFPIFTYAGNGLIGSGFHNRLYTDPLEEAIYEVRLDNGIGLSAPIYLQAGVKSFTMPPLKTFAQAVQALSSTPVDHSSVSITWTYNGNVDIQYRLDGGSWTSLATNVSTKPKIATGLVSSTYYEFRAAPTGTTANWSNISRTKTLQAPLPTETSPPPTSLVGSLNGATPSTAVDLSWNRNSTTNTGVKIYQNGSLIYTGSTPTEVSKTITGLTANTTYDFKVKNIYAGGDSIDSNVVTITTDSGASANAPSGLTAGYVSSYRIDLSWTNHTSVGGIDIERSLDGVSGWAVISTISATRATYIDSGLSANTYYAYRVKNNTVSGYSNIADAVTAQEGGGNCVLTDTLIWAVLDGKKLQIPAKDIEVGAIVLAINSHGLVVETKVKQVILGSSDTINFLTTSNGKFLACTPSHPILTDMDMGVMRAKNIEHGQDVMVFDPQFDIIELEMVESKETLRGNFNVMIFELEKEHTFISNGIVSHNVKNE